MKREKLGPEEIEQGLRGLKGWSEKDEKLTKRFEFDNFADSLAFVNKIGSIAEKADHHPDIRFGWGFAEIETTTHDRGGITDFDLDLAARIDAIA